MLKTLKQQQGIILAAVAALAVVVAAGYFSAVKRSEPKYRNKVEEMMFEEGNKSPKYVITLPDKKSPQELKEERQRREASAPGKQSADDDMMPQQRVLSNMPLLIKLKPVEDAEPLKNIESEAALVEKEGDFQLPKTDGLRKPWSEYGRKVRVQPNFFRVAVVFKNFGIDKTGAQAIMHGLPPEVSFSFSPYAPDAGNQIKEARSAGHETYMDLLLPSKDYLSADTGPLSMDITSSPEELIRRVKESLSVGAPLGGMLVAGGDAGVDSMGHLEKVLQEVGRRGLLLVNASGEETVDLIKVDGLARGTADIVIDGSFRPDDIRDKLAAAERFARNNGQVVVVAEPKPVVVLEIRRWLDSFSPQLSYDEMRAQNIAMPERPFAPVPLSNTVIE